MKIRSGFVSNSSSSSFVILAKDEDIKNALNVLKPAEKKFIKNQFLLDGTKVLVENIEYKLCHGSYYTDNWDIGEDEDEEDRWNTIKVFSKLVKPICIIVEY